MANILQCRNLEGLLTFHGLLFPMHSSSYAAFLALLYQARIDVGMTQEDVARKLGVPQSYVSKCESGTKKMDVTELHAWLNAIDRDWVLFMLVLGSELDKRTME